MGGGNGLAEGISARLTPSFGRKFAFQVGAVFMIIGGFAWWKDRYTVALVFGCLGTLLVVAGALVPSKLGPVYQAWMGLAHAISRVTTPILMAFIYFIVIFPVGLLIRLLGRNPIRHRPKGESYWFDRNQPRGTMKNQF